MDEAVRLGLIEETATDFGGYRFCHALIQETLIEEIALTRRVSMRAEIARALEKYYGDGVEEHAAELLHHFTNAQLLLGDDDIVRYAIVAGNRALSIHAYEEAARCFQTGLDRQAEKSMDDKKASLSAGMGRACTAGPGGAQLRYRRGYRGLIDAFDYYHRIGRKEEAIQIAENTFLTHQDAEMARMLEDALELAGTDSIEEARILCNLGNAVWNLFVDAVRANASLAQALALARKYKDSNLELLTLANSAVALWQQRNHEEALQRISESERVTGYDDVFPLQRMYDCGGQIYTYNVGDSKKAMEYYEESYRLSVLTQKGRTTAVHVIAGLYQLQGDWDEARHVITSHLHITNTHLLIAQLAQIEYETGNADCATDLLTKVIDIAKSTNEDPGWETFSLEVAILFLVRRGADRSYLDVAENAALKLCESLQTRGVSGGGLFNTMNYFLAYNFAIREDADETKRYYALADRPALPIKREDHGFILGAIGDIENALARFRDAEQFYERAGYLPRLAWARYDIARTLMKAGDADSSGEARAALKSADKIARDLGMIPLLKLVEEKTAEIDAVDALSVSRKTDMPVLPTSLTKREVEVLSHIAAGKTNQEISRDLYISEKTVHTHLTNIFSNSVSATGSRLLPPHLDWESIRL